MTENEIINRLHLHGETMTQQEAFFIMDALEEIQQYRAIGTVERFEQLSKQFAPHNVEETSCHLRQCNKCDMYRKENEKYHEIGTIDEFKALKEKNTPKKPDKDEFDRFTCPDCLWIVSTEEYGGRFLPHCEKCGQSIDWSE